MRRTDTILQFVTDRWKEGKQPFAIHQLAQAKFKHKCCGLSYVEAICRRLSRAADKATEEMAKERAVRVGIEKYYLSDQSEVFNVAIRKEGFTIHLLACSEEDANDLRRKIAEAIEFHTVDTVEG